MMSLVASTVRETIEAVFKTRAIMLEYGIRELVGDASKPALGRSAGKPAQQAAARAAVDASVTKALFDHPQINGLFSGEYPKRLTSYWRFWRAAPRIGFFSRLPSYIPARNFAIALLDTVARGPVAQGAAGAPHELAAQTLAAVSQLPLDLASVRRGIPALPNTRLQRALLNVLDEAGSDIEAARQGIARWYDSGMDRVSGWYRRETQAILFMIGLLLAASLNIDAVAVGQRLLVDQQWRVALVASTRALNCEQNAAQTGCPGQNSGAGAGEPKVADIGSLEEVLGKNGFMLNAKLRQDWPVRYWFTRLCGGCVSTNLGGFLEGVPGYFIVAFATSLGAAFWFDLLSKLMMVRSTLKPPGKRQEAAKADGTSGAAAPVAPIPAALVDNALVSVANPNPGAADDALLLDPNERLRKGHPAVEAPP